MAAPRLLRRCCECLARLQLERERRHLFDPPVNVVLPVSRSALAALWAAFGED